VRNFVRMFQILWLVVATAACIVCCSFIHYLLYIFRTSARLLDSLVFFFLLSVGAYRQVLGQQPPPPNHRNFLMNPARFIIRNEPLSVAVKPSDPTDYLNNGWIICRFVRDQIRVQTQLFVFGQNSLCWKGHRISRICKPIRIFMLSLWFWRVCWMLF
jgi:hypothetical protein